MLTPFVQHTGTIPRYYPAPSLLMFALSKQWKNSMMSPTSPLSPETPLSGQPLGKNPAPSYLHLFKSSGSLERELERLEIDDESLIYVADAEVGGRRGVVKVEGTLRRRSSQNSLPTIHASGSRSGKDATGNGNADDSSLPSLAVPAGGEEGRTTWVVQILDSEEAQKWIGAIKNAVLSQRSIRAGLGVPSSSNSAVEPRGDMDVIMSMRAQGLSSSSVAQGTSSFSVVPLQQTESFSSPMGNNATIRAQGGISPTQSTFASEGSRDSPTSSISRSQSASVVAALNSYSLTNANGNGSAVDSASVNGSSLFTIGGSRPRSPSSASVSLHASSPSPPPDDYDDEGQAEGDSFGRAGTSLLSMLRTNSVSSERPMSPVLSIPPTPRVGTPASVALLETPTLPHMLDRKILPDSDRHLAVENQGLGEAFIAKTSRHGVGITLTREQDDVVTIPGRPNFICFSWFAALEGPTGTYLMVLGIVVRIQRSTSVIT
ncbi:hypothetical protein EW026_g5617 [Hermanssonia centrifuga]|uniref:PH domain-containing protein n=1 Tax=Hermanssonia centrifuga TaxID=98765 RepID=A0A4S4KDK6_9APHY|nr:hypothetical protein EW026_g5617 [Hermanssonia centrifuga]